MMKTDAVEALSKIAPMAAREASRIYAATKQLPVGFELIKGVMAVKAIEELGEIGDRWWWKDLRSDNYDIICHKRETPQVFR